MKSIRRDVRNAATEEARQHNATVDFTRGGKHMLLRVTLKGVTRSTAISQKQGDNCLDWVRQNTRRLIREILSCNMVTR
jgi:hypothetical protein